MASIAFDSSSAHDAPRLPISLHPAFPGIVALWFAALLGIGSMVLPVALLERIVDMTGIAALVPAASPPLGFMARGLIALASGIAGAVLGVVIARRVADAHDGDRPSRVAKFASGARRPIDINEEIGGEGLVNGFGLPVNRRRALAIAEDDRPSDFLYMAPLPGHDDDDHALAFDERPFDRTPAEEPLELDETFADLSHADESEPEASLEDESMTSTQEFHPAPTALQAASERQEFRSAAAAAEAEPLEFSAPSLARRAALAEAEADACEHEDVVESTLETAVEPHPEAPEPHPFRGDWAAAPVTELGLVQLVQRLGASLERRREWLASTDDAPAALLPPAGFDPAPAEEAAQAMAAYFGKPAEEAAAPAPAAPAEPAEPAPRPNLLRSWHIVDNDDDLDAMPSFSLPLRKSVSPTIAFDEPETPQAIEDEDEPDDSYSSLLAMRNPFAPKGSGFVRIDEPEQDDGGVEPAVVFPGRGQPAFAAQDGAAAARQFDPPAGFGPGPAVGPQAAPAGTDAALRAALATLQRMSGTA